MDRFYGYQDDVEKPVNIAVKDGIVKAFHNCSQKTSDILDSRYQGKSMKILKGDFDYIIPVKIDVLLQIVDAFKDKVEDQNARIDHNIMLRNSITYLEQERNKLIVKISEYEQRIQFESEKIFKTHGFIYKPK
jgi:hypothetical protein